MGAVPAELMAPRRMPAPNTCLSSFLHLPPPLSPDGGGGGAAFDLRAALARARTLRPTALGFCLLRVTINTTGKLIAAVFCFAESCLPMPRCFRSFACSLHQPDGAPHAPVSRFARSFSDGAPRPSVSRFARRTRNSPSAWLRKAAKAVIRQSQSA